MNESTVSASNAMQSKFDFAVMEQDLSFAKELYRTLVIVIGFFLNCVVLLMVSFSRQLRYPRHIFWVAISFFECLILVDYSLELSVIINHDRLACRVLVPICSVDYSLLLLCLSLAAMDRYLSIVRYEWYQANVTNGGVILLISIASALTLAIIDIPFWTGYLSVYTCTISATHQHYIFLWNSFLGIVCIILHFKTLIETKNLILQFLPIYRRSSVTVTFTTPRFPSSNMNFEPAQGGMTESVGITTPENPFDDGYENERQHPPQDSQLVSSADHQINEEVFLSRQNGSQFNRLEIEDAYNISVNILPFWLCAFLVSCNSIALHLCTWLEGNCDTFGLMWTFAWDVFMIHSVYNPMMYLASSSEFHGTILHITRKLITNVVSCWRMVCLGLT